MGAGLVLSVKRVMEKDAFPRRLYVLLAIVAGPLGIFVAAAVWLTFTPVDAAGPPGVEPAHDV